MFFAKGPADGQAPAHLPHLDMFYKVLGSLCALLFYAELLGVPDHVSFLPEVAALSPRIKSLLVFSI